MRHLIVLTALFGLLATTTGCGSGNVKAQAIENTTAKVTYQFEDLIDGKRDPSKLTALEKRVYKRSASMLRETVAKALKKDDLARPPKLWGDEPDPE